MARLVGSAAGGRQPDALLTAGRTLLYPGLALSSLLLLRGPAEMPIGDILMACAGVLGALSLTRRRLRVPGGLVVAAVLVAAGALIASANSAEPLASLGIGVRLIYLVLVVPWILLTLLTEQQHVVRAVLWWLGGAAVCAVFAVLGAVLGDVVPGATVTGDNRFTGLTEHVSDFGGITTMAVGAGLGAVFSPLSRRRRRPLMVGLAISATGLLLSGSVSGMLAVIAVVLFLIVQGVVRVRRAVVLGVGATIAGGFALTLLADAGARDPLERFLVTTGQIGAGVESNTYGSRLELASLAVEGIVERPLTGHGLLVEDNVLMRVFTVHNNFLAAWHGGGVLLFAGVVIASAMAVRYCVARDLADPLHVTVASAVIAGLAFAQTAPSIYNRYYWLPIAFAVILAVRSRALRSTAVSGPQPAVPGTGPSPA